MAIYNDVRLNSPVASVEFSAVPEGNATYVRLRKGAGIESMKQWLTQDVGQKIDAQTQIGDETLLVTRGNKTQQEMLSAFSAHGSELDTPDTKKKVNLWKLRGLGSMIGQPMQLLSSWLQPKGLDTATMGFAISNMAANLVNMIFGAQQETDPYQLRHIKSEINARLTPYLPQGSEPLDVDDERAALRNTKKPSLGAQAYNFAKRYSVTGGDIGLRYIGAISLALPATKLDKDTQKYTSAHWKKGFRELGKAEFGDAWKTLRNDERSTLAAGLMYIAGKAISLTSKVPDPYNKEKKHTALDTVREKVVFPISSIIEAAAAYTIALDRLNLFKDPNGAIKINVFRKTPGGEFHMRKLSFDKLIEKLGDPKWLEGIKGKQYRDWLGGVGGAFFGTALVLRIFAPFGVREVDMAEVNAHVADSLAMVPPDKLPQATAETAAFLTEHFEDKKEKKMQFGKVYGQLVEDLQKYHNISLPGMDGDTATLAKAAAPEATQDQVKTFARPELKKSRTSAIPPASYQDRVSPVAESIALGP